VFVGAVPLSSIIVGRPPLRGRDLNRFGGAFAPLRRARNITLLERGDRG
jgi:hypothetical protein